MDDDAGQDGTSPGDDSPADDLSDMGRARARGWFQNLLNLCRLHTGAECIGHFTEHFNLTESRALTLIFGHLYGSSLEEESPDELLFGLASRNWEDWSEFLEDSKTTPPTTNAMWSELRLELQEVFSLTVGASSNEPNTAQEDNYDKSAKGLSNPFSPGWHANPSAHPCDTLILSHSCDLRAGLCMWM